MYFTADDRVQLGDFGSVCPLGRGGVARVSSFNVAYAPRYIPPEVFAAALGVMAIELRPNTDSWTLATTLAVALLRALLPDGDLSVKEGVPHPANFDLPAGVFESLRACPDPQLAADLEEVIRAMRAFRVSDRKSASEVMKMPAWANLAAGCQCNDGIPCCAHRTLRTPADPGK